MRATLATLTALTALGTAITITACTSTPPSAKPAGPVAAAPVFGAPMNDVPIPKCLNVQEGDRHVELHDGTLFLAEEGTPKKLEVEKGLACEKFEIIRNARQPAVLLEYTSQGTHKVAIAAITDATWILKPTQGHALKTSDARTGKAVITITGPKTKTTVKP